LIPSNALKITRKINADTHALKSRPDNSERLFSRSRRRPDDSILTSGDRARGELDGVDHLAYMSDEVSEKVNNFWSMGGAKLINFFESPDLVSIHSRPLKLTIYMYEIVGFSGRKKRQSLVNPRLRPSHALTIHCTHAIDLLCSTLCASNRSSWVRRVQPRVWDTQLLINLTIY
jgi:hypothetical protein